MVHLVHIWISLLIMNVQMKKDDLKIQYCQNRSVNILTRVCRELTRLSKSKHTLVNILTIDFTITKIVLLMETKPNQ